MNYRFNIIEVHKEVKLYNKKTNMILFFCFYKLKNNNNIVSRTSEKLT